MIFISLKTNKMTYMVYAAQNSMTNIVIILLSAGANPNVFDQVKL